MVGFLCLVIIISVESDVDCCWRPFVFSKRSSCNGL